MPSADGANDEKICDTFQVLKGASEVNREQREL